MYDIGNVQIYNESNVVNLRNRVGTLLKNLQYNTYETQRMVSAVSELCRLIYKKNHKITFNVAIEYSDLEHNIIMRISSKNIDENLLFLDAFFSSKKIDKRRDEETITITKRLPNPLLIEDKEFIESVSNQFMILSQDELFDQLEENNKLLEKQSGQLKNAIDQANTATQAKSDFLANMSHEIRTPMNAIIGLNNLQMKTKLNKRQLDYAKKIGLSATNLLGIINDILDFSKIEAGKLTMEKIDFSLEDVLGNVSNVISMKTLDKGIEFAIILDHKVPINLNGDPLRLTQVLLNLTNNSVKFTKQGEVVIHITVDDEQDDSVKLRFAVRDTGIGMTSEQVERLFRPFTQADPSTTRQFGGTGLGLAISKRIVEKINGEFSVESEPDKGSTFTFTGEFTLAQGNQRKKVVPESLQHLKVLVVDDNSAARQVLNEYLETFSFEVVLVASGFEAVSQVDETYDLVILDWKMPKMDGIETWVMIVDKLGENIPKAIMVSAYDKDQIEDKCLQLGIEEVLVKPITESVLYDSIIRVFNENSEVLTRKTLAKEEINGLDRIRGSYILVVEDNEINQQVARESLESEGFVVDIAEHGGIAIEKLSQKDYDAVLMDLQMPVLDGYKATTQIRELNIKLPIIALSADAMSTTEDKVLQVGMNDYITKPIDFVKLLRCLVKWIKPKETRISKPKKHPMKSYIDLQMQMYLPSFEVEKVLKILSGNKVLYSEILDKFMIHYDGFGNVINSLVDENNWNQIKREFHKLKGIAGNVGAMNIYEYAKKLEDLSSEVKRDEFTQFMEVINNALNQSINEIRDLFKHLPQDENGNAKLLNKEELMVHMNRLGGLLDSYDVDAVKCLQKCKLNLIALDYKDEYEQMSNLITNFNFESAMITYMDVIKKLEGGGGDVL